MKTRIAREMIKEFGIEIALMVAKRDYEQAKARKDYEEQGKFADIYCAINYIKYNK